MQLYFKTIIGHIDGFYQGICVPIQVLCNQGVVPEFFINGHLTLWPTSGNSLYNVTYSETSRSYSFCFSNVTEDIVLTEYCYRDHSAGCSLCSVESSEVKFLSYTYISYIQSKYRVGEFAIVILSPAGRAPMISPAVASSTTSCMLIIITMIIS